MLCPPRPHWRSQVLERLPLVDVSIFKARKTLAKLLEWRKADELYHFSELRKVLCWISITIADRDESTYLNRVLHLLQAVTHRIGLVDRLKYGISDGGLVQKVIDRHVDSTIEYWTLAR